MDDQKQKRLFDAIYNFVVDIFNNGIIEFIRKALIIGFGVVVAVIILLFVGWRWFSSDETYKSKHLLKPELEITIKNNKADTTYVYHLE